MTQKIINKTPHAVYILDDNNQVVRMYPKSNGMIRIEESQKDYDTIDGVPITSTTWGGTKDVPKYVEGTFYIVSQLVKNALPSRKDLLVPKQVVRDKRGNILGCKSLDIGKI